MYDIPFDRSFLQLSNGIRHVMPSTDRKLELTAKASMAQPISQPAVCSNGFNTAYSDIVQMPRHCRAPCTSGCRGATAFTGWKHMVLFEGGRRLLTKIETIWGNSCTMSNAVKFSHAELGNSVK